MRVAVETNKPTWDATVPTPLLEAREFNPVSADGQRFVMIEAPAADPQTTSKVIVVQHFDQELKRLVPTK